jgi:phosphoenolpyruvate-protein kinase (PTS system EI component)
MQHLQGDLARKESMIAEQSERMREELLDRDRTIANQAITLKKIESDLACVTQQTKEQAQAQMNRIIERDMMIVEQANILEQLKQDLVSVTEQSSAALQVQMEKLTVSKSPLCRHWILSDLQAERESEVSTLRQRHERLMGQYEVGVSMALHVQAKFLSYLFSDYRLLGMSTPHLRHHSHPFPLSAA